jgi:Tfp pilus assembly protein PilN
MSVRAVGIDFAGTPRPVRVVGTVLAAVGVAVALWAWDAVTEAQDERDRQTERLDDTRRLARRALPAIERVKAPAREAPDREMAAEVRAANEVLDRLALPWDALFADVERALGPDVALTLVQPDPKGRTVVIDGEARHLNALLTFLARLDGAPTLAEAHLRQHEWRVSDPHRPLAFSVEARWTPAR